MRAVLDCEGFLPAVRGCLLGVVSREEVEVEAGPLEEVVGLRRTVSGADTMLRQPRLIPATEESEMDPYNCSVGVGECCEGGRVWGGVSLCGCGSRLAFMASLTARNNRNTSWPENMNIPSPVVVRLVVRK